MAFLPPNQVAGLPAGPCCCSVLLTQKSSHGFLGFPENLKAEHPVRGGVVGRPWNESHLYHLLAVWTSAVYLILDPVSETIKQGCC